MDKKIILFEKPEKKRNNQKVLDISQDYKEIKKQQEILRNILYSKEIKNEEKVAKREINNKLNSYKRQDISKKRYSESLFITFKETIELLITSNLSCYYCCNNTNIFYDNIREKSQWTLDRIDNDVCHSKNNVVISCLACNLQKRRRESEAFKFMKQMKIKKI